MGSKTIQYGVTVWAMFFFTVGLAQCTSMQQVTIQRDNVGLLTEGNTAPQTIVTTDKEKYKVEYGERVRLVRQYITPESSHIQTKTEWLTAFQFSLKDNVISRWTPEGTVEAIQLMEQDRFEIQRNSRVKSTFRTLGLVYLIGGIVGTVFVVTVLLPGLGDALDH